MWRKIAWVALVAVLGLLAVSTARYRSWVEVSGRRLESASEVIYTAAGPIELARSDHDGPVILLLHGTPGGYDQTGRLPELAAEAGFAMVAPSRPGYLRTPLSVGRTPAEQADAYAALLDALSIDRVAVVGVSGGGPSALEFAIRHGGRCWALVDFMGVSRARLREETRSDDLEGSPVARLLGSNLGGWLLLGLLERNPEALLEPMIADERILDDPERRQAFFELAGSALLLSERRRAGIANDVHQFESLEPPRLEAIDVPTLVLHGTADRNVPLAMGQLVAQRVPGARLVTIEGADHFMSVSHTEQVMGALFDFLREHRPGQQADAAR